jgi:hypothetical protein
LFVIGWILNGIALVNAFGGTVSVIRPSRLVSFPPAVPMSLVTFSPSGVPTSVTGKTASASLALVENTVHPEIAIDATIAR